MEKKSGTEEGESALQHSLVQKKSLHSAGPSSFRALGLSLSWLAPRPSTFLPKH